MDFKLLPGQESPVLNCSLLILGGSLEMALNAVVSCVWTLCHLRTRHRHCPVARHGSQPWQEGAPRFIAEAAAFPRTRPQLLQRRPDALHRELVGATVTWKGSPCVLRQQVPTAPPLPFKNERNSALSLAG